MRVLERFAYTPISEPAVSASPNHASRSGHSIHSGHSGHSGHSERSDLRVRSLLDDPALRRAMGLAPPERAESAGPARGNRLPPPRP